MAAERTLPMVRMSRAVLDVLKSEGDTIRDIPDEALNDFYDYIWAIGEDLKREKQRRKVLQDVR
jgi:hypothetical protein